VPPEAVVLPDDVVPVVVPVVLPDIVAEVRGGCPVVTVTFR
jgi:hypothetical protein